MRFHHRLVFAAWLALSSSLFAQTRYTITRLGNFGGEAIPYAVSAKGAIVGDDRISSQSSRAFIYSNGVLSFLPSFAGHNTPRGINSSGAIAAVGRVFPGGMERAFVITNGVVTDIGSGVALAINDAGTVVGRGSNDRAFSYSNGVIRDLGTLGGPRSEASAINNAGVITGYSYVNATGQSRAFRYSGGTMISLGTLGGDSVGMGINSAGVVVGSSNNAANTFRHACIFDLDGRVVDIGTLGGSGSMANAINSAGTVVGSSTRADGVGVAFVYTPSTGMVDLNTLVVNLSGAEIERLVEPMAINDAGQIIGHGTSTRSSFIPFLLDPLTAPTITSGPLAHVAAPGTSVVLGVTATGANLSYQWRYNNTAIAGATGAMYAIPAVTAANVGNYSVVVTNPSGSAASSPASLSVTTGATSRLANLSILTSLAAGGDSFTMGYVVGGANTADAKPLVVRAAGPSLAFLNVAGALDDPKLELFAGTIKTDENDNWGGGSSLANAMAAVGAFAFMNGASRDAAVFANITSANNSVRVSAIGSGSGAVLAELYDATPASSFGPTTPRLINVSILKVIGPGLTAGFVIAGTASKTVLVRAIGPTLGAAPFNIPGVVTDPQLSLFGGQTRLAENNDWGGTAALAGAFTQAGAFALPGAARDAAVLMTLPPGNYTVQVDGVGGTTGVALIEVYDVP